MKSITCPICCHQDFIDNRDLDPSIHKGFTIGKGKKLYFEIIWHQSGHCSVFTRDKDGYIVRRWINGDSIITIHFK